MPPVPGTFNGNRFRDLRNLLVEAIEDYYKAKQTWDDITACRFYEYTTVVTVRTKDGVRKDKWRMGDRIRSVDYFSPIKSYWHIEDEEFIYQADIDAEKARKAKHASWQRRYAHYPERKR